MLCCVFAHFYPKLYKLICIILLSAKSNFADYQFVKTKYKDYLSDAFV